MDVKITLAVYFTSIIVVWTTSLDMTGFYNKDSSSVVEDIGCGRISRGAVLVKNHPSMTMMWCTTQCWKKKHHYSLTSGSRCLCGDSAPNKNKVPEAQCSYRCKNATAQTCGGDKVATRMKTGYVSIDRNALADLAVKVLFSSMGVKKTKAMQKYTDGKCIRWEPSKKISFDSERMEKMICVIHCYYNRFIFAMMSVGVICTCTSMDPVRGATILNPASCNKPCAGNSEDKCGGPVNVHSIHLAGVFKRHQAFFRGHYIAKAPLKQNWDKFLGKNPAITKELVLGRGVSLNEPKLTTVNPMLEANSDDKEWSLITATAIGVTSTCLFLIVTISIIGWLQKNNADPEYAKLEEKELKEKNSKRRKK